MYFVYKIFCKVNNKVYIGQTKNFKTRKNRHLWELRHNRNENIYLQTDFNLYTEINFIFEIIETCMTREDALIQETYWINYYGRN